MKEQLISFETAKLAKEKGFSIPIWDNFSKSKCFEHIIKGFLDTRSNHVLPTQSLLQKWLREVHNIHIKISLPTKINKQFLIVIERDNIRHWNEELDESFNTYEEALEVGLREGLKLIINI